MRPYRWVVNGATRRAVRFSAAVSGKEGVIEGEASSHKNRRLRSLPSPTTAIPLVGLAVLAATWGSDPPWWVLVVVGLTLAACVISGVHHAEVIGHRVGEPFGSLVLAIAVTIIEVALIITVMISSSDTETLARDTVFAAVMITTNGVVGVALLVGSLRRGFATFNAEGSATAFATVLTLATLSFVVPRFTSSRPAPEFSPPQLAFAALASLALYTLFIVVQTVRHRDLFMPEEGREHGRAPTNRQSIASLGLLVAALVAVVGLAKVSTGAIEDAVRAAGAPISAVGVIIALLVLSPESLTAVRHARHDRVQASFNLAYGSAIASIGLTIPTIALASIWLDGPLVLGLDPTQIVLLGISAVVGALTLLPGRATLMEGGVHLVLFAAYIFLAFSP